MATKKTSQNNTFIKQNIIEALVVLNFVILGTFFYLFPEVDIYVSNLFFDSKHGGFYLGHNMLIFGLYKIVPIICAIASIVCLYLAIKIFIKTKSLKFKYYKKIAYFLLVAILGPGLVVNVILKDHVGRARPSQVIEFGGHADFTPAFVISDQCAKNCSFVSGHASVGFMFFGLAFLMHGKNRRDLMILSVFLGLIFGFARIAQGGHFLSDVIFSGFFTLFVAYALEKILKPSINK
jgi:lipid A 4'-phosphatase